MDVLPWTFVLSVFSLLGHGNCLKCFECANRDNPACGVYFKAYQYEAVNCGDGEAVKCGLQRQPEKDNFVGILRRCYQLGMLGPGVNESDGCQQVSFPPTNYTFTVCLCSQDYCNMATTSTRVAMVILVGAAVLGYAFAER